MKNILIVFTLIFSQVTLADPYEIIEGKTAQDMIMALEKADLLKNGETLVSSERSVVIYKISNLYCEASFEDVHLCEADDKIVSEEASKDLFWATVELSNEMKTAKDAYWTHASDISCMVETKKDDSKVYRCLYDKW